MSKFYQEYLEDKNRTVELSIIIPCLNEEDNIETVLNDLSCIIN